MAEWKLELYRLALGTEMTVRGRFNGQDPQFVHHYENGDTEFWLIVSTDENEPEIERVFSTVNFSTPGTTVDDAWWIVWCSTSLRWSASFGLWGYKVALLEKMQDDLHQTEVVEADGKEIVYWCEKCKKNVPIAEFRRHYV